MKKLLIATSNPGKLAEIRSVLRTMPIDLVTPKDLNIQETPKEKGSTFAENALIKAKFYFDKTSLPILADDGGLEIEALNGKPGALSHRWIDPRRESTDEELIDFTMKKLKNIPLDKRGAQLRLVMVYIDSRGKIYQVEEKVKGIIPLTPSQNKTAGYPYRSLLFLPQINKFYNEMEMTKKEIEKYGHRIRAVKKLLPFIMQIV